MRLALVADIHSNLPALKAASDIIEGMGAGAIICAGDIVGYGPFPNECCSWVAEACSTCIAGNHDRSALSKDVSGMNPFAAAASIWTAERLDPRSRDFLSGLRDSARFRAGDVSVKVFHGSPSDPVEYVEEEMVSEDLLARCDSDVLVLGHTHVPFVKRFSNGMVVNPGAVGQPRDGDPRGSLAMLDTERLSCDVVRFEYPINEVADSIRSEGLPHILAERLSIGR